MISPRRAALLVACGFVVLQSAITGCVVAQNTQSVQALTAARFDSVGARRLIGEFSKANAEANRSAPRVDSLADALVEVAIDSRATIASDAIANLIVAGAGKAGPRYRGAAPRLMEIFRRARDMGV